MIALEFIIYMFNLSKSAAAAAKLLQSCPTLRDPIDGSPPGFPVLHYIPEFAQTHVMTERLHFHFTLSCIGERNGNPPQCSCLENPRDGGAWWAAVYGVAQSRTRLKRLSSSSSSRDIGKLMYPETLKKNSAFVFFQLIKKKCHLENIHLA